MTKVLAVINRIIAFISLLILLFIIVTRLSAIVLSTPQFITYVLFSSSVIEYVTLFSVFVAVICCVLLISRINYTNIVVGILILSLLNLSLIYYWVDYFYGI